MRVAATGRYLLIRTDFDLIDTMTNQKKIIIPDETIARMQGGFQVHTILSIGESAFDDEPPEVRQIMQVGRQVITGRYPGHEMDMDPFAKDSAVVSLRMINSSEVHGVIAKEDEEGADV